MTTPTGPRRPLPPGGMERAIAAGRRKRHQRRVAAAASLSALSVAGTGVLAALPDTGAPDRLTPADEPTATATASPSPGLALPTGIPTLPLPTRPTRSQRPVPSSESPTPDAEPGPPDAPRYVGHGPRDDDDGPWMDRTTSRDVTFCEEHGQVGAYLSPSGFCTSLDGPASLRAGQFESFRLTMCRQRTAGTVTIEYENRYEAYFALNEDQWTWAGDFDFPVAPRSITFEPGDCATWEIQWGGQDDAGYSLPPGEYELVAVAPPFGEYPDYGPPGSLYVRVDAEPVTREPRSPRPSP